MLEDQLQQALDRRAAKGTLRRLTSFPSVPSSSSSLSSGSSSALVDFSSNDYLSLSTCPTVRRDFIEQFTSSSTSRLGSTGSRLLDGNTSLHEQVESELVQHFESPSGLLFNSGYEANVSIFSTLPQPSDIILFDSLVHASVHDGIRRSRTLPVHRISFQHNSAQDLERILSYLTSQNLLENRNVWLAVESVYSMDGDVCPLPSLLSTLSNHVPESRTCVVIDEAHSTGLYGKRGKGFTHALGLHQDPRIKARLMTFGKAMGASGAVVLCSSVAREFLVNYARPLIFSTALGHPQLYAMKAVLSAVKDKRGEERSARTFANSSRLVEGLLAIDCPSDILSLPQHLMEHAADDQAQRSVQLCDLADQTLTRASPIIPLLTTRARPLAQHLRENGLLARPICYPTVPKGEDRVRVCVHADNTEQDIDRLVACVAQWVQLQLQGQTEEVGSPSILSPSSQTSSPFSAALSPNTSLAPFAKL